MDFQGGVPLPICQASRASPLLVLQQPHEWPLATSPDRWRSLSGKFLSHRECLSLSQTSSTKRKPPSLPAHPPPLQLTSLDITGCPRACSPAAFAHLSALQQLRALVAKGCRLHQEAVATLAQLTNLGKLRVADNPALQDLAALTSLR